MNQHLIDLKLKKLIELCSETLNYKKIAVVGFILLSNRVDEIGVRFGIKPRNKEKGEKIFEYMNIINEILNINFNIPLFKESMIEDICTIELLFLRKRGDISLPYIKDILTIYYDLRSIDIPDVFQVISKDQMFQGSSLKVLSFFSGKNNEIKGGKMRPLILQKLREEERQAEMSLAQQFDRTTFERTLQLKTIRQSIENQRSGKIRIQGALKDNINYIRSKENILYYLIIGWLLLFIMLGAIIIFESIIYPEITVGVSPYLLLVFGPCLFLILVYRFYKRIRR